MHIIGIRKFSCIYQIVKEVDFLQLKNSGNPFKELVSLSSYQPTYHHKHSVMPRYHKFSALGSWLINHCIPVYHNRADKRLCSVMLSWHSDAQYMSWLASYIFPWNVRIPGIVDLGGHICLGDLDRLRPNFLTFCKSLQHVWYSFGRPWRWRCQYK